MTDHEFGGAHTEIKLRVLKDYLSFYATALKNQKFRKLYIDGFAGTGERVETVPGAPLWGEDEERRVYEGSAKIALEIDPPFDKIHFVEGKRAHMASLRGLLDAYPGRDVMTHTGDANEVLPRICASVNWKQARAVAFVDPYGINANWTTLRAMQETEAIDVWYLFNTFGAYRQLPKHLDLLEPEKDRSLTRVFGSDAWKRAFFLSGEEAQADLFGGAEGGEKNATVADVAAFMRTRLAAVFPFVSKPLPLAANNQPQAFTLFLCVSNPSPKAWGLAAKVAKHILDKQGS